MGFHCISDVFTLLLVRVGDLLGGLRLGVLRVHNRLVVPLSAFVGERHGHHERSTLDDTLRRLSFGHDVDTDWQIRELCLTCLISGDFLRREGVINPLLQGPCGSQARQIFPVLSLAKVDIDLLDLELHAREGVTRGPIHSNAGPLGGLGAGEVSLIDRQLAFLLKSILAFWTC